jgi:REP element-mobilizing transposase RayT/DNA-binding response OmpR family regulator
MQKFILVATPQSAFGELLRLSLEELGACQVYQVQTGDQALANANRMDFHLAILDGELSGQPLTSLVQALRYFHPEMRLIVIPPENNRAHPSLAGLKPDGYLSRPFYIPDMVEIVEKILATVSPQPTGRLPRMQPAGLPRKQPAGLPEKPLETSTAALPWLMDVDLATQRLTSLMQESPAHAALIARNGKIWAHAGRLDQTASQEIMTLLDRCWDESEKSDLARFVRLNSTKNEYLLYATLLVDDLILATVCDPYTPISHIRTQISLLARLLAAPPVSAAPIEPAVAPKTVMPSRQVIPEPLPAAPLPDSVIEPVIPAVQATTPLVVMPEPSAAVQPAVPVSENPPPVAAKPPVSQSIAGSALAQGPGSVEILARLEASPLEETPEEEDNTPLDEASQISLAELLSSMPSPDPEVNRRTTQPEWAAEGENPAFNPAPAAFAAPNPAERVETRTAEKIVTAGNLRSSEGNPRSSPSQFESSEGNMPVFMEPPNHLARFEGAALDQAQTDSLADTRPMLLGSVTQLSDLEPISAAYNRLSYTCLLIPRMPYHYLTGELADWLNQWLIHCCLAFGWRLEGLAIRPEYMQWIVQVSPAISPGNLVRIVRQRTSQYIFSHYPQINYENPSGDFWAPGYLILSGSQLPSSQMLREFIVQTRRRQGINR